MQLRRLLLLILGLWAVAWGSDKLVLATGAPGGVYRLYGRGLAPILQVTTRETAGAVENLKLIRSGEAQLAFATADSAYDAVRGVGAYVDGGPVPVKTVAVLYPSLLHVVTLQSSRCRTFADLAGCRVSLGSPGSSSQVAAGRLLEQANVPVVPVFLGVKEAAQALAAGEIEAFFWISGLPCEGISAIPVPIRLLDTTAWLPGMVKRHGPVYAGLAIPGGIYQGCAAATPALAVNNILAADTRLSDERVYNLLTTLFAHLDEVHQVHPEAARLTRAWASTGSSIDFHPGALRFYGQR